MSEQLFLPVTKEMISLLANRKLEEQLFLVEHQEKSYLYFRFQITVILTNCNFGCQKELINGARSCLRELRRKCRRMCEFAVHMTFLV